MIAYTHVQRTAAIALVSLVTAGCASPQDSSPFDPLLFQERTGVVFVTQNVVPAAVMEALFEGPVVADPAGCLRLDSPDNATVVWPKGFTITENGSRMVVHDATGRAIGTIGESFRLGGGEVQSLDGSSVSAADRERATAHCPGRYWIVGDVP